MKTYSDKKDIQLSCRLELLPGTDVLSKVINAKDFGFDAVALPGRYLNDFIDDLKKVADDLPLPLSSLSLGFKGSLVSSSASRRDECCKSLIELFDLCGKLRIPFLNMPPILVDDNPNECAEGNERDALLLEQLPMITDEAGKRGVTLLLEPVNRYESNYLNAVEHAYRLCEKSHLANLGITADMFHMQMEELNTPATITKCGKWIKYFHVAENTRQEPGIGSMDFAGAFNALKSVGYNGFLELESRSLSGSPDKVLPQTVEFLHRTWDQS